MYFANITARSDVADGYLASLGDSIHGVLLAEHHLAKSKLGEMTKTFKKMGMRPHVRPALPGRGTGSREGEAIGIRRDIMSHGLLARAGHDAQKLTGNGWSGWSFGASVTSSFWWSSTWRRS